MSLSDRKRWDERYTRPDYRMGEGPRIFLKAIEGLLPRRGRALDLAAGEGQNAVYLAQLGLDVLAVDVSKVGIAKARQLARKSGVKLRARVIDLEEAKDPIAPGAYQLITLFRYLQRDLTARIAAGLAPGGLAVLELVADKTLERSPKRTPGIMIRCGELRDWFPQLTVLCFEEAWDEKTFVSRLAAVK